MAANPTESAQIIGRLFDGEPGPCRDTVLAGTAAALLLVGKVASLADGVIQSAKAIDEGLAKEKLESLRA